MKIRIGLMAVLAAVLVSVSAEAKVPGRTDRLLNDYAGIVDADSAARIEATLVNFKKKKKVELVVTVIASLEGVEFDEFMKQYTPRWRRMWPFENDRRIHFVIVTGERRLRIGVGHALDEELPASEVNRLVGGVMAPSFGEGRYAEGILAGVERVISRFK